jgi:hypothetical protein
MRGPISADYRFVSAADELIQLELMLNRFKRLLGELMRGAVERNAFQPWEIEIMLDFNNCRIESKRRSEILRQYRRAVERQMATGPGPPMKLSAFLELRARRRENALSAD